MKPISLFLFLIILPGCFFTQQQEFESESVEEVYDLNESSNIIISLLKKDELPLVLAESEQDKESIDTLIKNFSPSEMAFEAEVLNHKKPVIILYYDPADNNQNIINALTELAQTYKDTWKFVKIDKEKLFKITQNSEVDVFPTVMIIHNRKELGRLEKPSSASLENELKKIVSLP